ncbi:MAG: hypothetical protein JW720_02420 [Sedimentisphaerales bacterium]|nr:hypothetical protein [Sedimentisphaerales bacterium]
MADDRRMRLADELQRLLEEQIRLARQGKVHEIEALSIEATGIAEEIGKSGILKDKQFNDIRVRIERLYHELNLSLSGQLDEVGRELCRIRRGKRTVGVYRDSLQAARK